MTKVQTAYKLSRKLGDEDIENLSRLPTVYGVIMAKISPALDELLIEYDASRLTVHDLESVLGQRGLPIITPTPGKELAPTTP
jgi:hypothetical protein